MSVSPRYKMIVAVDDREDAPTVLAHAFDQASRHDHPELHVLRVVPTTRFHREPAPGAVEAAHEALGTLVLESLSTFAPKDWRVRLHARPGRPVEEILDLAAEVDADLIVVGAGATAAAVLRDAPAPVLMARVPERGEKELSLKQCPKCVEVRESSEGERWFCEAHSGGYFGTSTLLMPHGSNSLGHGLMW
jgi:nucleotide-binding universal stress UspA family protein